MRNSSKWIVPVLILALAVLAACGSGGEPAAPEAAAPPAQSAQEVIAATLEVAMHDLYYGDTSDNLQNPPVWTVGAGERVQVNLVNEGGLQHNWAIVKPGSEVPVPFRSESDSGILIWDTGLVDPGQSASATFTAPSEPGEYTVICTVAGHYPAMQGRLVVQ